MRYIWILPCNPLLQCPSHGDKTITTAMYVCMYIIHTKTKPTSKPSSRSTKNGPSRTLYFNLTVSSFSALSYSWSRITSGATKIKKEEKFRKGEIHLFNGRHSINQVPVNDWQRRFYYCKAFEQWSLEAGYGRRIEVQSMRLLRFTVPGCGSFKSDCESHVPQPFTLFLLSPPPSFSSSYSFCLDQTNITWFSFYHSPTTSCSSLSC